MADNTTLKAARDAIEARWITSWATTTHYTFENEKSVPPEAVAASAFALDVGAWCRVVVRNTVSAQETLGPVGARKFERQGDIMIQVFVPVDMGTAHADTLAMAARAVFEGTKFSGVSCYAGLVREIGPDGRWFQVNVTIPFTYYETL